MKEVIREFCPITGVVIIRAPKYGRKLQDYQNLFKKLNRDFPELSANEVEVTTYGDSKRWMSALAFHAEGRPVPNKYKRVERCDFYLRW